MTTTTGISSCGCQRGWPTLPVLKKRRGVAVSGNDPRVQALERVLKEQGLDKAEAIAATYPKSDQAGRAAAIYVARRFTAQKLGEMIAAWETNMMKTVVAMIEKLAASMSQKAFVGKIPPGAFTHNGAIAAEQAPLFFAKSMRDVLPFLRVAELGDVKLVRELFQSEAKRKEFIAARKDLTDDPQVSQIKRELIKALQLMKELSALEAKFWLVPYDQEMTAIESLLNHDIKNAFARRYGGTDDNHLIGNLYGLSKFSLHLRHYLSVLKVNKSRLDGVPLDPQRISFSDLVETAVTAASFRLRMPLNYTLPEKPGHINCFVEKDFAANAVFELLELILYNLIKNAEKAAGEAKKPRETLQITVQVQHDEEYPGVGKILVQDNCGGLNIPGLVAEAKRVVADPRNREITESLPVFAIIGKWQEKPFVIRTLSLGEIFDLVFVPRLSGFHVSQMSSGLGLAEAAEFAALMGMKIFVTNRYDGGALIWLLFGEEPKEIEVVIARELGLET